MDRRRSPVIGEVELAWRRARCPIVAITGTNGKTTVTTLVQAMLAASGLRAVAAGNIGLPLLDAVGGDAEVVVAEVSSFQLALTSTFRPAVAAWLNFSADHLDWHATVDDYRDAKARLWANSGPGDVAVANAEDPVVLAASEVARPGGRHGARPSGSRRRGLHRAPTVRWWGRTASVVARSDELARTMPHDVVDALVRPGDRPGGGGERPTAAGAPCSGSVGSPTGWSWSARLAGCGSTTTPRRPRPAPCWPPSKGVLRRC